MLTKKSGASARNTLARRAALMAGTGLLATVLLVDPAIAQTAATSASGDQTATDQNAIDDIVVTAQKREQSVQSVPIAITAASGEELRARNITDVQRLVQIAPGVIFSSANSQARISIRGISYDGLGGSPAEARVAYHLDGVYLARTSEILSTFYDIDRIEVLRGPQGTLFGRNAIAGSVSVLTRNPTNQGEGYLEADVGNYNHVRLQGAVGGPIADGVSARISFLTQDRSGYDYNVTNKTDINDLRTRAVRAKLKFEPTSALTITLSADYYHEKDKQGQLLLGYYNPGLVAPAVALGGTVKDGNPRHDFANDTPTTKRNFYGFSANINWDLGDRLDLVSVTGYRHTENTVTVDVDSSSLAAIRGDLFDRASQFSEELRLQKAFDRGHVMVGAFYFTEKFFTNQVYPLDLSTALYGTAFQTPFTGFQADGIQIGGTSKAVSWAAFAEGDYDLTNWLNLTVGARYGWERKRKINEYFQFQVFDAAFNPIPFNPNDAVVPLSPIQNETNVYKDFSPKVTLTGKIDDSKSVYATFSEGFRSGGYNLGYNTPGFFPEKLTNYEIGFKTEFLDRKLRLNGSAFIYNYKDLQVNKANSTVGNSIQNAASARLKGVELEFVAIPVDGLRLDGSVALLKSEFTDFTTFNSSRPGLGLLDLTGNRLPQAPKYTASYGAQYTTTTSIGQLTFRAEGRSISNVYFDQFNVVENSERAYSTFNAYINWKSNNAKLYGSLYIRNIGNVLAKNGSLVYSGITGFNIAGQYDPPRTFGATLGVRF